MSRIPELLEALRDQPASLRSDQLLEEWVWEALDLVTSSPEAEIAERSEEASRVARRLFADEEATDAVWRLWRAGQLEGLARLLRAHLGRELSLSTTALIRGFKNALPILQILTRKEWRFKDIARLSGLDESQIPREINRLDQHGLVEVQKVGRECWVRITPAGRKAAGTPSGIGFGENTFPYAKNALSNDTCVTMDKVFERKSVSIPILQQVVG